MVWLDFDGSCVDSKFQTPGRSWTLWLLLALLAPRRMLQTTEITKNTDCCCCFDFHRSESRRQISRAKAAAATGFIDPSKILLWLHRIDLTSVNLQYNTLGIRDKRLVDQEADLLSVIFFFSKTLPKFFAKHLSIDFLFSWQNYKNENKEFWVPWV